jgi:hypothetical protein
MTIQEMYQEMKDQSIEDGYNELDAYDDFYTVNVDIDYTTQE